MSKSLKSCVRLSVFLILMLATISCGKDEPSLGGSWAMNTDGTVRGWDVKIHIAAGYPSGTVDFMPCDAAGTTAHGTVGEATGDLSYTGAAGTYSFVVNVTGTCAHVDDCPVPDGYLKLWIKNPSSEKVKDFGVVHITAWDTTL